MPRKAVPAARKKPAYHHGDLRNALVKAALVLIRQHGPNALSFREVAKLAGVSHAAPYRHFKDRHALLADLAQEGFRRLGKAMADVEAGYPDPRTQIIEAGCAYVELAIKSPEITQLMFGGYLEDEHCTDELREDADKAFRGLLKIIENGKTSGLLKRENSQALALATWSMAHGYAMLVAGGQLAHVANTKKEINTLSRKMTHLLLDGLLA